MDKAIIVQDVSKKYTLYENKTDRLLNLFLSKNKGEPFYALRNVNFIAEQGEVVGFIGTNGSGKSTLSNIIAGVVPETEGKVIVNGETSIIAVSAGLKNELTGRDNIELKLLMLGFNKPEIISLEEEIIDFSELGHFIDQPVKSYSSGMKSRLGFAISVSVDPDILIIDEALSVGDRSFSEKSLEKMKEFKEDGKTMIFVSHSLNQMKKFCDKILWLEYGRVKDYGSVEEIIPKYESFLNMWKKLSKDERDTYRNKVINNTLDYQEYINNIDTDIEVKYKESLRSKIGRIRVGESLIYESLLDLENSKSTKEFKDYTFYIKKQAVLNDEKFYLLSDSPSHISGKVGWIRSSDVSEHNLIYINMDSRILKINGDGEATDRPWGARKNIVLDNLASYKGEDFYVLRTDIVGKNIWYYGKLRENYMWIHKNYLCHQKKDEYVNN